MGIEPDEPRGPAQVVFPISYVGPWCVGRGEAGSPPIRRRSDSGVARKSEQPKNRKSSVSDGDRTGRAEGPCAGGVPNFVCRAVVRGARRGRVATNPATKRQRSRKKKRTTEEPKKQRERWGSNRTSRGALRRWCSQFRMSGRGAWGEARPGRHQSGDEATAESQEKANNRRT